MKHHAFALITSTNAHTHAYTCLLCSSQQILHTCLRSPATNLFCVDFQTIDLKCERCTLKLWIGQYNCQSFAHRLNSLYSRQVETDADVCGSTCRDTDCRPLDLGQNKGIHNLGAGTLLGAPGHTTRNKKLLGALGLTTIGARTLLGAPGLTTMGTRTLLGAPGLTTIGARTLLGALGLTTIGARTLLGAHQLQPAEQIYESNLHLFGQIRFGGPKFRSALGIRCRGSDGHVSHWCRSWMG